MSGPVADVVFARRAAYLESADTLVLADLHLGRAEDSNVQFPVGEREDVLDRLGTLLERFAPETVVVAGDLLHAFGRFSPSVAESVGTVERLVADAGAAFVVTPGNHDALIEKVFDGPTPAEHRLPDGTVVYHGHERPEKTAGRYVFGHDHPAIEIEGKRHPCFLYGEGVYRSADVLVLPAFTRLARGVAVNGAYGSDLMSPVLTRGIETYRPLVYDADTEETLAFPPLTQFREML